MIVLSTTAARDAVGEKRIVDLSERLGLTAHKSADSDLLLAIRATEKPGIRLPVKDAYQATKLKFPEYFKTSAGNAKRQKKRAAKKSSLGSEQPVLLAGA